MAAANGWGYVDVSARFGSFTEATAAGLMRDDFHPSVIGGQIMAAMVARYITNTWLRSPPCPVTCPSPS